MVLSIILFIPNLIVSPKNVEIGITAGNKTKKGNFSFNKFDTSMHKEAAIPTLIAFLFKSFFHLLKYISYIFS